MPATTYSYTGITNAGTSPPPTTFPSPHIVARTPAYGSPLTPDFLVVDLDGDGADELVAGTNGNPASACLRGALSTVGMCSSMPPTAYGYWRVATTSAASDQPDLLQPRRDHWTRSNRWNNVCSNTRRLAWRRSRQTMPCSPRPWSAIGRQQGERAFFSYGRRLRYPLEPILATLTLRFSLSANSPEPCPLRPPRRISRLSTRLGAHRRPRISPSPARRFRAGSSSVRPRAEGLFGRSRGRPGRRRISSTWRPSPSAPPPKSQATHRSLPVVIAPASRTPLVRLARTSARLLTLSRQPTRFLQIRRNTARSPTSMATACRTSFISPSSAPILRPPGRTITSIFT